MADVYGNSSLTITASAASNSSVGFLRLRIPSGSILHIWEYLNAQGNIQRVTLRAHESGTSHTSLCNSNALLETGACVLQERLLSPQVLGFGLYRMSWECNSSCHVEGIRYQDPGRFSIRHELSRQLTDQQRSMCWYKIVAAYTKRLLTDPSNKLPALLGFAQRLF